MNLEAESSAQLMRVQSGTVLTQREQIDTFSRLRDGLRSVVHSYGWRTEYPESAGSSQASSSFPCSTTESAPPIPPYNTGNCSTLHNGYTHDNRCSGIHHVQWFLPQASDPLRPMLLRALGCRRRHSTSLPVVRRRLCLWDLHHR